MKLRTMERNMLVAGGTDQSANFTIKSNPKAFRILMDGIYSDKIKAPLRELSTNAWDAHIMAGTTDRPFDVHLPNCFEPWFSVRDYGTGLSHEDTMGLYTTFFESTKSDRNDQTGAFGIGSKSPFAYTDTFSVYSIHGGMKREYALFVQNNGIPGIQFVSETPSNEHNGLEIKFPVAKEHFREFSNKARNIFSRFPLLPKITGEDGFALDTVSYLIERDTFKVRNQGINDRGSAIAVMGCIGYPIDATPFDTLTDMQRAVIELPIDIDFAIGELDISTDRERLAYDEITRKNIKDRLDSIGEEIVKELKTEFEKCTTFYQACARYHDLTNGPLDRIMRKFVAAKRIQWRGRPIEAQYIRTNMQDHKLIAVNVAESNGKRKKGTFHFEASDSDMTNFSVKPASDVVFIYDDMMGRGGSRARMDHFITEHKYKYYFFIRPKVLRDPVTKTYPMNVADNAVQAFIDALGTPSYIKLSDIDVPKEVVERQGHRGGYTRSSCWIFKYSSSNDREMNSWQAVSFPSDEKINEGGFYVHLKGRKAHSNGKELGNFHKIMESAIKAGFIRADVTVYGFQSKTCEEIADNDDWIDMYDYLNTKLEEIKSDPFLPRILAHVRSWHIYDTIGNRDEMANLLYLDELLAERGVKVPAFMKYSNTISSIKETVSKNSSKFDFVALNRFCISMNFPLSSIEDNTYHVSLKNLEKETIAAFPMLSFVNFGRYYSYFKQSPSDTAKIVDYIIECHKKQV